MDEPGTAVASDGGRPVSGSAPHQQLADLADQLGLGLAATEAGRIVAANRVFCDLVGRSRAELVAMPSAITLFAPEARSALGELYALGLEGPATTSLELDLLDRDGNRIPVAVTLSLSPGPSDSVNAVALVRDRTTDVARAAELARFSLLVDRLPAGVLVWDGRGVEDPMDLRLAFANQAATGWVGVDPDVHAGGTMAELFPAVEPGNAARLLALCGTDRAESFGEVVYGEAGATPALYEWQALALPGDMVAAIFQDITAERAGENRRRHLLHRLLNTGDEERRRLALDLHDDTVQQIAAAAILVEGLQRNADSPQLPDRLAAAGTALRAALRSLRRLVFELSPPELVDSGLEAAVSSAAGYLFADTDTTVAVSVQLPEEPPTSLQTAAFRIVAEALTNAYKHARATQVRVDVSQRGDSLVIEVADDGVGLPHTTASPGHIGVRSMRERAAAHGGMCSISSDSEHGGTVVYVEIPTAGADISMSAPADPPAVAHEDNLVTLRQQLESLSAAAGEARRAAWQARHQLRTAMKMVEALLEPTGTTESVARISAELLGRALRAGCAIHLLTPDGQQLRRAASWHPNPELLAALDAGGFADRPAATPQVRTVLASGEPVLGDRSPDSDAVPRHATELPLPAHSYIAAPLIGEGTTLGTVTVVRIEDPERLTSEDVEFVMCVGAQVGIAMARARLHG